MTLHYSDESDTGDIITNDVYVPKSGLANTTTYCVLQFNKDSEGGGYVGIQNHPKGRAFIFSMWDPIKKTRESITAAYLHHGTTAKRFGEKSGGIKIRNFALHWEPDTWMTICLRRWDDNAHTKFGLWIQKHNDPVEAWYHLATLDFPVPNIYFKGTTSCFLEDWGGHGNEIRQAYFRQGFKRLANNEWKSLDMVKAIRTFPDPGAANFINKYKATSTNGYFHVLSGGNETPDNISVGFFEVLKINQNPIPKMRFTINKAIFNTPFVTKQVKSVNWQIDILSSPQFSYTIKIDDRVLPIGTVITSTARSRPLTIEKDQKIHLTLESVHGEKKLLEVTRK